MKVFTVKVKRGSSAPTRPILNEEGQSLAEFILTFGIVCLIVFIFVKLAFNFTKGYMIHYANFMTSRSYLVQDSNSASPESADGSAEQFAYTKVYQKLFPSIPKNNIKFIQPASVDKKVYVGVRTSVQESFSLSSMIGGSEPINLTSESFLGRTPTISECAAGVCSAVSQISGGGCGNGDTKGFVTLWDNGC